MRLPIIYGVTVPSIGEPTVLLLHSAKAVNLHTGYKVDCLHSPSSHASTMFWELCVCVSEWNKTLNKNIYCLCVQKKEVT